MVIPNADEDTEWNDVLREKGILPPRPRSPSTVVVTHEQLEQMVDQVADALLEKHLTTKGSRSETEEDDEDLEDLDLEDGRAMEAYRRQRMAEFMQEQKATSLEAHLVREITRDQFVQHVTEASKQKVVVVHLYGEGIPTCSMVSRYMQELAQEHSSHSSSLQFLCIRGQECIPNYPDRNLPTLLVYSGGTMCSRMVGVESLGGMQMQKADLWRWIVSAVPLALCNGIGDSSFREESGDDME